MALTAVGSIAFDSVTTPFGASERQLGGSAVYASLAASLFTGATVVGPVGGDFTAEHYEVLESSGVDTSGIQLFPSTRTFFWRGRYEFDMSVAHTEATQLNVFEDWRPRLSRDASTRDVLFLAAMDPEVQLDVREQWSGARWAALDTIDYWIEQRPEKLFEAIARVDIVLMNDIEARELTGEPTLLRAARTVMSAGPQAVVLRLGQYGCALLTRDGFYSLPSYPLADSVDPTGCGDAFAGGFLGYLSAAHATELTEELLRRAATYGAVMASYCQEEFGAARLVHLTEREVSYRFEDFRATTHFVHVPTATRPHDDAETPTRLERPQPTPTTVGLHRPHLTPSTVRPAQPHRTPSTEPTPPATHPLPHFRRGT